MANEIIEGGTGKGKDLISKDVTTDDHLSAMKFHLSRHELAKKQKDGDTAMHHARKYWAHKDQLERTLSDGDYMKDDFDVAKAAAVGAVTLGVPVATYLSQMIKSRKLKKKMEQKPETPPEKLKEDAPAMSVGSGVIAGLEPDVPPVTPKRMMKRKKLRLKEMTLDKLKSIVYNERG